MFLCVCLLSTLCGSSVSCMIHFDTLLGQSARSGRGLGMFLIVPCLFLFFVCVAAQGYGLGLDWISLDWIGFLLLPWRPRVPPRLRQRRSTRPCLVSAPEISLRLPQPHVRVRRPRRVLSASMLVPRLSGAVLMALVRAAALSLHHPRRPLRKFSHATLWIRVWRLF